MTQLVEKAGRRTAWEFLQHLREAVPYELHTTLTDSGIQFSEQPQNRNTIYTRPKRYQYDSNDQLRMHLADFTAACNFARRPKTIGGLIPCGYICKFRTAESDRFILDPIHQRPGVNIPKSPATGQRILAARSMAGRLSGHSRIRPPQKTTQAAYRSSVAAPIQATRPPNNARRSQSEPDRPLRCVPEGRPWPEDRFRSSRREIRRACPRCLPSWATSER
nr:hypothetical protein [Puniceibacterium confluentis]